MRRREDQRGQDNSAGRQPQHRRDVLLRVPERGRLRLNDRNRSASAVL